MRVPSRENDEGECHAVVLATLVVSNQIVFVLGDQNPVWRIGAHSLEAGGLAESVGEVVHLSLVHSSLI